ncbi:MAG TPA: YfiR family protein [Candidatus Acidoferrum sp.]
MTRDGEFTPLKWSDRTLRVWLRPIGVCVALLFVVLSGVTSSFGGQQAKPEEYQVKAVYLYNFGRFVQWPASGAKDDPFTICILGRDPFEAILDTTLANEKIDSHKLMAKRIANYRDAKSCRIVFISASEFSRAKEILSLLEGSPVLTVSDMPSFVSNGGMIQFVLQDNKVRFEVNLTAAEKAGLTLSSQLLKVATEVRRTGPGGDVKP